MPDSENKPPLPRPQHSNVRFSHIVIVVVLVLIGLFGTNAFLEQRATNREVTAARPTADKMITAIQHQDVAAARNLGDASFQLDNSPAQLKNLFVPLSKVIQGNYTIAKTKVTNGSGTQIVSIYYKFNAQKPYYLRVTVTRKNTQTGWKLINFSGSPTLSTLVKI